MKVAQFATFAAFALMMFAFGFIARDFYHRPAAPPAVSVPTHQSTTPKPSPKNTVHGPSYNPDSPMDQTGPRGTCPTC